MNDSLRSATLGARLCEALDRVILGKPEQVRIVVAAFCAGGHVLLEGLPGLGKTVLAKSLAGMTGLTFKRIQCTPDLMPSDITGTHVLQDTPAGKQLRFVPGPVFTHFLLADEINRASPKTQAALLEAMGEGSVTLLGESHSLEPPFFVIATQNPIEMEGTNPLPEAQLDRFAVKIDVPATDESALLRMLAERRDRAAVVLPTLADRAALRAYAEAIDAVFLPEAVAVLIARLTVRGSPTDPQAPASVKRWVRFGPSPRAALWLSRMARALAAIDGRSGAGFEDVAEAAPYVFGHRMILSYAARVEGVRASDVVGELYQHAERDVLALTDAPSKLEGVGGRR